MSKAMFLRRRVCWSPIRLFGIGMTGVTTASLPFGMSTRAVSRQTRMRSSRYAS